MSMLLEKRRRQIMLNMGGWYCFFSVNYLLRQQCLPDGTISCSVHNNHPYQKLYISFTFLLLCILSKFRITPPHIFSYIFLNIHPVSGFYRTIRYTNILFCPLHSEYFSYPRIYRDFMIIQTLGARDDVLNL